MGVSGDPARRCVNKLGVSAPFWRGPNTPILPPFYPYLGVYIGRWWTYGIIMDHYGDPPNPLFTHVYRGSGAYACYPDPYKIGPLMR